MKLAALCLPALLAGCAHADYGQFADSASTAWALSKEGFAEGNPLLSHMDWPGIMVTKIVVTQAVKAMPSPVCEQGLTGLTVLGYGAALWNVGLIVAGSGFAGLPLALVLTGMFYDVWEFDAIQTCADAGGSLLWKE